MPKRSSKSRRYYSSDSSSDENREDRKNRKNRSKGKKKREASPERFSELDAIKEEPDQKFDDDPEADVDPKSYFLKLLKTCKFTLEAFDDSTGKSRHRKNFQSPIVTYIKNYIKIVERTPFDDHFEDIADLYEAHKLYILKDNPDWLLKNNVVLTYQNGVKRLERRPKKAIQVHLSTCFKRARDLYDKHYNEAASSTGRARDFVLLETRILHYLYLLCIPVAQDHQDGEAIDKLALQINTTSEHLGINDGTFNETFSLNGGLAGLFGGGNMKETLTKVIKYIVKAASEAGFDLPPQLTEGENLGKVLEVIQKIVDSKGESLPEGPLGELITKIKSGKNHLEMVECLTEAMKNPEMFAQITEFTGIEIPQEAVDTMTDGDMKENIQGFLAQGMDKLSAFLGPQEPVTPAEPDEFED